MTHIIVFMVKIYAHCQQQFHKTGPLEEDTSNDVLINIHCLTLIQTTLLKFLLYHIVVS